MGIASDFLNDGRTIYFIRAREEARQPTKAHRDDAGWDLYVSRSAVVKPGELVEIHTDIQAELPPGFWAHLLGRSSTPRRYHLQVVDAVIDGGYRGELFIAAWNHGKRAVHVEPGMRLAQLIPHKIADVRWQESSELRPTTRGQGGFGSTGT